MRSRRCRSLPARASAIVLLSLAAACATAPHPPAEVTSLGVPGPLQGPGAPDLEGQDRRAVATGVQRLSAGDVAGALSAARQADAGPAGRLLELQAGMLAQEDVIGGLAKLTEDLPGYAAAWSTLAVAAERAGDEPAALDAARRTAELWPRSSWGRMAEQLAKRWIDDRLDEARSGLATDPELSLAAAEKVLALAPGSDDARLVQARALVALERDDRAEEVLAELDRRPETDHMRAVLAERRGDLTAAMERYQALPPGYPGRDADLARTRLAWRLSNAPAHVREALASPHLTRAQLAAVLVAAVPGLEAVESGSFPLLSDVVHLPARHEVLLLVDVGVLDADLVDHRFLPDRPVSGSEVADALERVAHLVGLANPVWCEGGEGGTDGPRGCLALPDPPTGQAVADLAIALQGRRQP